jgi:hypothetical protein
MNAIADLNNTQSLSVTFFPCAVKILVQIHGVSPSAFAIAVFIAKLGLQQ